MKKALFTGITGQDRAYLAEFLLGKNYKVHGIKRRAYLFNTEQIDHLYEDSHKKDRRMILPYGDMTDACVLVMNLDDKTASDYFFSYPKPCFVNVGSRVDNMIRELAKIIRQVVCFNGKVVFGASKPDGTPLKLLDISRLRELEWQSKIGLLDGIQQTYRWYRKFIGSFNS